MKKARREISKAELLKMVRESANASQSEFGLATGIDQSNYAKYESGSKNISYDRLIHALNKVGVVVNVQCIHKGQQITIID